MTLYNLMVTPNNFQVRVMLTPSAENALNRSEI